MSKVVKVGIIGGGVSGSVIGLQLADLGIDSILFEKEESLVNGPPFCHLHAGGNLYPDISDEQCRILLKQSIDMARLFPQSIDQRPTFISIPTSEKYQVSQVRERLDMLVSHYKKLIEKEVDNKILGEPEDYYKIYEKQDLDKLSGHPMVERPETPDDWMINTVHLVDYNQLKMPVILVQEFGWNMFRLGAQAQIALETTNHCELKLNTEITGVKDVRNEACEHNWEISSSDGLYKVEFLVNSCGFRTGELDEALHIDVQRLIEFKAAYVSKWDSIAGLIPELIFHGERGTPHGMAQLTPYRDNYYQIHGMTEHITLFDDGLVESDDEQAQPQFTSDIREKLVNGWKDDEIEERTKAAIQYVSKFVPSFDSAKVGGPPLYGAQQIPGDDASLRVGEVSFPSPFYARSEIVKASSALTVANQIISKMEKCGVFYNKNYTPLPNDLLDSISKESIDELAQKFTAQRGYPTAMSKLVIER